MLGADGGVAVATRRSARLPSRSPDGAAGHAGSPALPLFAPVALPEALLKPMDPSNIHVLVVGNLGLDEASGEPIADVLRASYRVTLAATDSEALALLRASPAPGVDLILKEHEPPGCDAVKFIPRVMKSATLRHIPVVVVSTRDDKVQVADALHSGAADYLVKPLRRNELGTMWAHVWRRWVGAQLSAAQAQAAAALVPATRPGRPQADGGSGDESSGEGSGQGSHDARAEQAAAAPPKADDAADGRDDAAPARPAAAVRTLPPTLDGSLFAPRAEAEGAAPAPPLPPPLAPAVGAAGNGQSAFLAYTTPGRRASLPAEPSESRPWPQDPSMAAAAAAASMALAAGMGQAGMALHPLHAATGTPFGLPFGLPPAFALFPDCMPLGTAAAVAAAQAQAQAAYGLRAGVREHSGRAGASDDDVGAGASGGFGANSGDADAKARRAAALKKFKEKRANRCFTKKIRYTSRKQLAEARPRNRGQFVRVVKDAEPSQEEGAALLALAGVKPAAAGRPA